MSINWIETSNSYFNIPQDMSDFTLYWNIISQPSRAVKSLIDIGKLSCSLQNVNIAKLEQRKK